LQERGGGRRGSALQPAGGRGSRRGVRAWKAVCSCLSLSLSSALTEELRGRVGERRRRLAGKVDTSELPTGLCIECH
jgi:hypothetical protein